MFRSRRLALRFAVAAIGLAAVFGTSGTVDGSPTASPAHAGADRAPADHELAVTARVVHPKSVLDDRSERTHPGLLLWVAAFLALLLVLQVRTLRARAQNLVRDQLSWAGLHVRGPPARSIAS